MLADYACATCDYLLEDQIVKGEDADALRECPICKKNTLCRVTFYVNGINVNGYNYKNGYSTKG